MSHCLSRLLKFGEIFTKQDDVSIDLFTSNIIGAIFIEKDISIANSTSIFSLTLITSVPVYMYLDVNTAIILSPSENVLEEQNGNGNYISDYYISEQTDLYSNN